MKSELESGMGAIVRDRNKFPSDRNSFVGMSRLSGTEFAKKLDLVLELGLGCSVGFRDFLIGLKTTLTSWSQASSCPDCSRSA